MIMDYKGLIARISYHIEKANFMGLKNYESTKLLNEAIDAIENLEKDNAFYEIQLDRALIEFPEWIPVKYKLPKFDEVVQITDGIEVGHGFLEGINSTAGTVLMWHSPFCDIDEEHITHWMPLPQPPKKENK